MGAEREGMRVADGLGEGVARPAGRGGEGCGRSAVARVWKTSLARRVGLPEAVLRKRTVKDRDEASGTG